MPATQERVSRERLEASERERATAARREAQKQAAAEKARANVANAAAAKTKAAAAAAAAALFAQPPPRPPRPPATLNPTPATLNPTSVTHLHHQIVSSSIGSSHQPTLSHATATSHPPASSPALHAVDSFVQPAGSSGGISTIATSQVVPATGKVPTAVRQGMRLNSNAASTQEVVCFPRANLELHLGFMSTASSLNSASDIAPEMLSSQDASCGDLQQDR